MRLDAQVQAEALRLRPRSEAPRSAPASWRAPAILAGRLSRLLLALVLASGIVALASLGFGAAAASAFTIEETCPLPGSNFQGADGNQNTPTLEEQVFCALEGAPVPTRDWQDLTNVTNLPDPQALDNLFEGGNKESEPGNWGIVFKAGGVTPPKDNIISAWASVDRQPKETFLYLAFERGAPTGDTFLTFELNKVKGEWENENGATIPCRTTGDLLISYNVSGGEHVKVTIYKWVTETGTKVPALPGDPECAETGHFEPEEGTPVSPPVTQGNMNFNETIPNFLTDTANPPTPKEFAKGTFGEAAVNLTKFFEQQELGRCFSFGQMWMSSRSSESIDSQLKDFVSPVPIQSNNCSISGRKFNDANGSGEDLPSKPGLEGWTIELLNEDEEVVATTTTGSGGSYTFSGVEEGSYVVREKPKPGWACDFPGVVEKCEHKVTITGEELNSEGNDFGNVPTTTVETEQEPIEGVVGTKFGDFAFVSGPPGTPKPPTPTGDVEFKLFDNSKCEGTPVLPPIFEKLFEGEAGIPEAAKVTPAAGQYWWVASYEGDSNNAPGKSECSAEPIEVKKAQPQITTSPTSGVTVGASIKDTATLSGLVAPTGTGTVTFKLYTDSACTNQVFSSTSGGISANGTASSGGFTTTEARTYYWIATYSGDANNKEVAGRCGEETSVIAKATPSIVTTQQPASGTLGATFKDGATVGGLFGAKPGGSVSWKLYSNSKCEGAVVASDGPVAVSANGAYATPSGAVPKAAGTYYWVATYSGDANNNGVSSACAAEPVVVNPPAEPVPSGTASAHGPSECVVGNAQVYVTGHQIKSVTFYLDGPKLKTVTRPDKKGRYLVSINTGKLRSGVHRVRTVVVFVPSSKTKSKTMSVVVARCSPPRPKFTG